jgi:arylsulfatase A-like enzyme
MLEAGVPVVYGYIEDAHDNHTVPTDPDGTFGPGEAGYVAQLKAYDSAFAAFFARLARDGITADNTLFIVTADENDHFAGGAPTPANCDGIHIPCTYAIKGEVEASLPVLLNAEFADTTSFNYDFDDAPGIWVNNDKGGQTDAVTRGLEHHFAALTGFDPIVGGTTSIAQRLADQTEQQFLHMVTSDPNRTPNFVLFADPDYFFTSSSPSPKTCTPPPLSSCFAETRNFAWNHGNFQEDIVRTWLGIVGPGVRHEGVTDALFTDHTDVRPTLLSLAGLDDDYAHDGRVIFEVLDDHALPHAVRNQEETLHRLAVAYKNINAPVGPLGLKSLKVATDGMTGTDVHYAAVTDRIQDLTAARDRIAGAMIAMLEGAAFANRQVDEEQAERLIESAEELLRHSR